MQQKGFVVFLALVASAMGAASAVRAQPTAGVEVEVSDGGSSSEVVYRQRSIARAPDGRFVVVYQGISDIPQAEYEIFARRYAADGTPLGDPFIVNSYTTGTQQEPAVGMAPDGRFVVIWNDNSFRDGTPIGIFGRLVGVDGQPIGEDFPIELSPDTSGQDADVAVTSDGSFVVVWSEQSADSYGGVLGRVFESDATPTTGELPLANTTGGRQFDPAVAVDGAGNFVTVWSSGAAYGENADVFARLFAPDATPCCNASGDPCTPGDGPTCGQQFIVNEVTPNEQVHASVARATDGGFAVVWQSQTSENDGAKKLAARRYNEVGSPLGTESTPYAEAGVEVRNADVAVDDFGRFAVSWETYSSSSYEGRVMARAFDSSGAPDGDAFFVNSTASDSEYEAAVAADAAGNFIVVWQDFSDDETVRARLFEREPPATTTTVPPTTLPTTTTTIPSATCGDASDDGSVSATDALAILRGAVGTGVCAVCRCDVDESGAVTATDALAVLRAAVGQPVTLSCVPC